jgi:hypothetical protein
MEFQKNSGKEKSQRLSTLAFYLVRLAGFEPTTPWFVAKYSIQLSYSRSTFTDQEPPSWKRSQVFVVTSSFAC